MIDLLPDFTTGQVVGFGIVFDTAYNGSATFGLPGALGIPTATALISSGGVASTYWGTTDPVEIAEFEDRNPNQQVFGLVISPSNAFPGSAVIGFRVDTIPEPSSALLCAFGLLTLSRRKRQFCTKN